MYCSGSETADRPFSHGDVSADETDESNIGERLSSPVVKERRELLKRTLSGYRQEKLKRKIPAEKQLVECAQEDLRLKRRMIDMMEKVENQNINNIDKLTSVIDKLTNSISEGFDLLKQQLNSQQPNPQQPYMFPTYSQPYMQNNSLQYGMHGSAVPAMQGRPNTHTMSYTKSLFQDDTDN